MKNILFTSTEKAESAGYIWNTLSGLIMAGQSVLLLRSEERRVGKEC